MMALQMMGFAALYPSYTALPRRDARHINLTYADFVWFAYIAAV
jgi:hypothetical protein